ncbi:MAG: hypothetical protein WEB06_14940 [Actinomycetota bacterium]
MRIRRALRARAPKLELLVEHTYHVSCDPIPEEEMLHAVGR